MADWVIVVDDDTSNLKMAGHILSKAGFRVTALKSGQALLDYVQEKGMPDLVLLDIKHIDNTEHINLTGHPNENILKFAKYLSDNNIPIWIRHVVVPNLTYNEVYLRNLGGFIKTLKTVQALDILPYHDMARIKYKDLGIEYPLGDTPPLSKEDAMNARNIILKEIKKPA